MKYNILKSLISLPITILLNLNYFLDLIFGNRGENSQTELSYVFTLATERTNLGFENLFFGFLVLYIYPFLFPAYIYNDLYSSGIYLFIRHKNRTKWLMRKVLNLFLFACIFGTFYVLPNCFTATENIDIISMLPILISVVNFLFIISMLQNILSIRFGSYYSLLSSYIFIFILISVSISPFSNEFRNFIMYFNSIEIILAAVFGSFNIPNLIFALSVQFFGVILISIYIINKVNVFLSDNEG